MPLLPSAFLFRVAHPCCYVKKMPRDRGDELLGLPSGCALGNVGLMDGSKNFSEIRVGWNEMGLGIRVEVSGKKEPPQGDVNRPRASDGVTIWIDTRDSRASHRAGRYCHQFHLLPAGEGADRDEPVFAQTKIHRALQDAPISPPTAVRFRGALTKGGYVVEAFLPAAVLNGYDPEQNTRLGFFWAVHDAELGEMTAGVDADFPYAEDPSLWPMLELTR
jgi:hypothetical protein